jgi:hypothetical protein
MGFPTGKIIRADTGKILYPCAYMGNSTGINFLDGYGYGMVLADGYISVAILNHASSVAENERWPSPWSAPRSPDASRPRCGGDGMVGSGSWMESTCLWPHFCCPKIVKVLALIFKEPFILR